MYQSPTLKYFLFPAFILMGIFVVYPVIFTVILSFYTEVTTEGQVYTIFIGLSNYIKAFNDPRFWIAFKNSLILLLIVPLAMGIGLGFALLLHRKDIIGKTILRTLVMAGMVVPPVIVGITWLLALDPWAGIYNKLLQLLGFPPRAYLYDPETSIYAVVLAATWAWVGFTTTTFIANLEAIPKELYESAAIDGAGPVKMFLTITLPLLRPSLIVNFVMTMLYALKLFDIIYVLGAESPPLHTAPLAYYMYYVMWFRYDYCYAATLAVILTAIVLLASFWY